VGTPDVSRNAAPVSAKPRASVTLAVTAVFSALIAVGTMIIIPLPKPLAEITLAPAIYLALAVLSDRWTAFNATAIGSFIGETLNGVLYGYPLIYSFGIVWARAPEVLIVAWARRRGTKALVAAMVGATIFETLAFFLSDWAFYFYGLFGYVCNNGAVCSSIWDAYALASLDFLTMLDLIFIPVALVIIRASRPSFRRLGFE
jgi:uncharacterized membrane protein